MALNFFQRRRILKKLNFLDVRPIRLHEFEEENEGRITLVIPKFKKKSMRKFFIPRHKSENFRIKLDKLGSEVWREMDGLKSVKEICEALIQKLGDEIKPLDEVESRVTKFLTLLYNQRYITYKELEEAGNA